MLTSLFAATALAQARTSPWADSDGDGLCDAWETKGFGPLDPKTMGCKPDHADIVICFRLRPGMTQATIQPTIDRMAKFYAAMPHQNPDGKPGLHLIPIVLPPLDAKFNGKGYIELYNEAFPEEWRGLAHGVLVENSPGGGGQANRPDWCGTGYNWWTILHEVGHQLGLPHEPKNTGVGSPLHTSLMNYDFLYQFDGDGEKVHFSDGRFASLRMKMTDLDEVLPFPYEQLAYLAKRPHYYTVKKVDATQTAVDWNRNGVVGEHHVRANIDDGYSVGIRDLVKGGKATGAPAVAVVGDVLYSVQPEGGKADAAAPSASDPAQLVVYRVEADGKFTKVHEGVAKGVTGDVSALGFGDTLYITASNPKGWSFTTMSTKNGTTTIGFENGSDPVLVNVKGVLKAVLRDPSTGALTLFDPRSGTREPLPVTSLEAAGVTWNTKKNCLAVVTVEDRGATRGIMVVHELSQERNGWKELGKPLTVGGDKSPGQGSGRPLLLIDRGLYQVYCKGHKANPNDPGLNYLCRQIATGTGWWIKMMGNEWANSRSVGGVCPYRGDVVYAYRWFSGPEDNTVWLHRRGSGIHNRVITDFDEVGYIFDHGLRDSLRAVQREQWGLKPVQIKP
ncbi:MAG: hypothetical protein JSS65_15310 [Armatimonadetes bacterium]|nr:hypothetical protein [Armatimonadota bacterium]